MNKLDLYLHHGFNEREIKKYLVYKYRRANADRKSILRMGGRFFLTYWLNLWDCLSIKGKTNQGKESGG